MKSTTDTATSIHLPIFERPKTVNINIGSALNFTRTTRNERDIHGNIRSYWIIKPEHYSIH